ncbi:MAG: PAS domain S-box protein, partial [Bacteroidia bacterium]|nr:PAS domain S-box protein [Bacteroidia bacterium]
EIKEKIDALNKENERKEKELSEKIKQIDEKEQEIKNQVIALSQLKNEKAQKTVQITELKEQQQTILTEKKEMLSKKEQEIQNQITVLNGLKDEINKRETQIAKQDRSLNQQLKDINKQQFIIYSIIVLFVISLGFGFLMYRTYRQKQKANLQLVRQKEQIEEINKELEKLSIVASKTDNSVLIFNKKSQLEWVNEAFTRFTGYTLEEYITERGDNLHNVSNQAEISGLIEECLKSKKSVQYHLENVTKSGNKIFAQTTLTPILDEQGNIKKLVAIDTDITELKKTQDQLAESFHNIKLLSEIGRNITANLSIEKICDEIYENLNKFMDATTFIIGIHNSSKNTIDVVYCKEMMKKVVSLYNYDLKDNSKLAVFCFKNNFDILINDLNTEYVKYIPNWDKKATFGGGVPESVIYSPLNIKKTIFGVLSVQSYEKNSYTERHLDIIKSLATYISIALVNARTYKEIEEQKEILAGFF